VNKTTLSKWENNEDPIGLQSDLLARAIVITRDKRLEKRAADHIRAFEKIADQQKRVRVEVDPEKLEYEYAWAELGPGHAPGVLVERRFFTMPTGIWIVHTRDGFVIAADGRKGVGETEATRILTDNQQKIFKVENPGRSLTYAMAGAVGLSNRGSDDIVVDLVLEIGKTATSLAEQRFVEPGFYVRKLCRPAHDLLAQVKQSGQLQE
jgi:hypothetical protein